MNLVDKETKLPVETALTADYINNFFSTIGSKLAVKFSDWMDTLP